MQVEPVSTSRHFCFSFGYYQYVAPLVWSRDRMYWRTAIGARLDRRGQLVVCQFSFISFWDSYLTMSTMVWPNVVAIMLSYSIKGTYISSLFNFMFIEWMWIFRVSCMACIQTISYLSFCFRWLQTRHNERPAFDHNFLAGLLATFLSLFSFFVDVFQRLLPVLLDPLHNWYIFFVQNRNEHR